MGCATNQTSRRWPNGIVPYVIHPEITGVTPINDAMRFWEDRTKVRFVRRYLHSDYLEFVLDASAVNSGYSNTIGRDGGRQIIAYSGSMGTRLLIHEIGHALGLIHEQKRSDRDEFVRINFDNIREDMKHNFTREADTLNSDVYDYRSIMHYRQEDFAIDSTIPVIVPLDPNINGSSLGSSSEPTSIDIARVNFIYPNVGVIRRSSSQNGAGAVSEISSLTLGNRVITAVKAGNGNLRMIIWNIDSLGGIQRLSLPGDPDVAGEASSISMTQAGSNIVTAVRNGSGNLFLISWQFENGKLVRKADSGSLAGAASAIKIINLTTSLLLTACRTGAGTLKLILWRVDAAGKFTRISDSGSLAGEASEISLLKLRTTSSEHIIATSVRAGNGAVKIITWAVSVSNNTITRRGDSGSLIGEGTQIQSAIDQFGHLIVSCRSGSGILLLISMLVSPSGREISRIADSHTMAGEISLNSLVARSYGVISGVRDGSGNLRLIKWEIDSAGHFTRLGDSTGQSGAVSLVSLKSLSNNPDAPLCTSVKDGSGNLLLISWDDQSEVGELQR